LAIVQQGSNQFRKAYKSYESPKCPLKSGL